MIQSKRTVFMRRIKWIFLNSGIIPLAFEHFLAMMPATILVPLTVNSVIGTNVIDISLVFLTSGLGTILFCICSRRTSIIEKDGKKYKQVTYIPAYLGSSFAYIGLTIYLLEFQMSGGTSPDLAYVYVGWAYVCSGAFLILLSLFYKVKKIAYLFSKFLPASVIGPAISLIGLELADTAVIDSGINPKDGTIDKNALLVASITLIVIILLSLIKRKIWKNTSIIFGVIIGCFIYAIIHGVPDIKWNSIELFSMPKFNFPLFTLPPNWMQLMISVIPATLIVFTENIGRVTVINRMKQDVHGDSQLFDTESIKIMESGLRAHGCATAFAAFLGSVPNTIYAENIAVMGIHQKNISKEEPDLFIKKLVNSMSVAPYILAALLAVICSFVGVFQDLVFNIPKPVVGGMELFLFGVISAPGIQLLVEQKVNYKKVSNQIITASVLITGISELTITFDWFELKGMSLGLVVGFTLNVVVMVLKYFGLLCDSLTTEEVLSACVAALPKDNDSINVSVRESHMNIESISIEKLKSVIDGFEGFCFVDGAEKNADFLRESISHAMEIKIFNDNKIIQINHTANRITMDIYKNALPRDLVKIYLNDYSDAIDTTAADLNYITIDLSRNISLRKVQQLIKQIKWA